MSQASASKVELASLEVVSFDGPLNRIVIERLREVLPAHVATRRWYRSKAKTISKIDIEDVLALEGTQAHLLILQIFYADGSSDYYNLPVSVGHAHSEQREESILHLSLPSGESRVLYGALGDERFRDALLQTIICEETVSGENGALVVSHTSSLQERCNPGSLPHVESFVSRAEQSNTSIIYSHRYILKLFRKLEAGVNPDVEIGRFLTELGFRHTPAVLVTLEYQTASDARIHGAGLLQAFVANQGDVWNYSLDSLKDFFGKALATRRDPPARESEHPLDLLATEIPEELRSLIGSYLESAALLGTRTAEMHATLTDQQGGPDFVPEEFTSEDGQKLYEDCMGQAKLAFELLRSKVPTLTGASRESADEVLQLEQPIADRFAAIQTTPIHAVRIRHHGDYHLGQVLYTGQDFMIIDFEGEPARPLAERRAKALALRDVAGMMRSFQYAAFAALFGQVPGVPTDGEVVQSVTAWAAAWNAAVSSTYLKAYLAEAGGKSFLPDDLNERRVLLDAFLLQKALYEVAYELNNRPDWLQIPLRGILSLVK